jgi:hypothetical protein
MTTVGELRRGTACSPSARGQASTRGRPRGVTRTDSVCTPNDSGVAGVGIYVEKRAVMIASDEIVRVEKFKIERFIALGLGRYDAIRAVEDGIDWHAVEALVQAGRSITVAVEISR